MVTFVLEGEERGEKKEERGGKKKVIFLIISFRPVLITKLILLINFLIMDSSASKVLPSNYTTVMAHARLVNSEMFIPPNLLIR